MAKYRKEKDIDIKKVKEVLSNLQEMNLEHLDGRVIEVRGHKFKIRKGLRKGRNKMYPQLIAGVKYKKKLYQKGIPLDSTLEEAKKLIEAYCEEKQVPEKEQR